LRKKTLALGAVLAAAVLTLAACGDDDSTGGMPGMGSTSSSSSSESGSDASSDFNEADVMFASDMITHHRQAVEMAELAETRAKGAEVKDLAAQIKQAQDPEIQQMSAWLTAWGEPTPGDHGGMDMSGSMPGMMSTQEMGDLMNASGAEFDQMFLTMMIAHHQGAIEMAQAEQADGMNADAIALAAQVEQAQTEEIATMQALLS
jgi:uncharacterized protein (DUF305 family)